MYLNGIMLISAALDFSTIDFHVNNDLPFVVFLPAYAATAWFHNKLRTLKPLRSFLYEVEAFAFGAYAMVLLRGDVLSKAERSQIIEEWPTIRGFRPNSWNAPTCGSTTSISLRNCCATVARPSAAWTVGCSAVIEFGVTGTGVRPADDHRGGAVRGRFLRLHKV